MVGKGVGPRCEVKMWGVLGLAKQPIKRLLATYKVIEMTTVS